MSVVEAAKALAEAISNLPNAIKVLIIIILLHDMIYLFPIIPHISIEVELITLHSYERLVM